ncbi:MAG: outer membrane beta-barrel protein [Parvibaculum sp.]|nr:outer membrane beta-barrel protein [Parvibaculum sp.]
MIANVAHAESVPSNAELFRMLKEQQQTISELRAELKQVKQERRDAAASSSAKFDTAADQAGGSASGATIAAAAPAQASSPATYTEGAAAAPQPLGRGAYVSLFGGVGRGGDSSASQLGTAFFVEAQGGPLAVDAKGQTESQRVKFGGAQLGYEWSYRSRLGFDLMPAIEFEGLHLSSADYRGMLENPNVRGYEQTFDDSFSMSTNVFLANAVVGIRTPYRIITPYIGGGIGAALVSVNGATSEQTNPVEPGINHFNAGADSSAWTFAAQAKAGVRVAVGDSAYVFGEYRYLYVGDVDQAFGSTSYPTHVPTSPWTVRFGDTSYNLFNVGVGVGF